MILQFILTWLVLRFKLVANLVKATPTMLTHKGKFIKSAMKDTRVSEKEICSVLREHGMVVNDANWVVLETDGRMTVIPKKDIKLEDADTMANVERPDKLPTS